MTTPKYFTLLHQATEADPMVYVKDIGGRLLVIFRASHLLGLSLSCHVRDQSYIQARSSCKLTQSCKMKLQHTKPHHQHNYTYFKEDDLTKNGDH